MKIHSVRKSAGATLGLMAAVLFIIFAIGAFLFYTGTLIGGNHELNRASDAGILSVAKQALVQPAVALNDPQLLASNSVTSSTGTWTCPESPIPYGDFALGIADQQIGGVPAIDLLTYNKCAAQAVLVGLNAERLGLQSSRQHAQAVAWAVLGIGKILQQRFAAGALNSYYDTTSGQNTLEMLGGGSTVNRIGNLDQAYVSAGRASNVFFYPDVVDPITVINLHQQSTVLNEVPQNTAPADPKPDQMAAKQNSSYFQPGEQVFYASGYAPITIMPGTAEASLVSFVPNNPQATPHAVDQQRFESSLTTPAGGVLSWVPPNAFKAHAQADVNLVGNNVAQRATHAVNAVSCAMIGCGDQLSLSGLAAIGVPGAAGGPQDTPARIPGGFVRIHNLPGYESSGSFALGPVPGMAGADAGTFDGSMFVLNNSALGGAKQITFLSPPKGYPGTLNLQDVIFTTDGPGGPGRTALNAWIAFNTSRITNTSDPNYNADVVLGQHRNPALDPFGPGVTAQYVAGAGNQQYPPLRQGTNQNQIAMASALIYGDATLTVDCTNLNGTSSFTDTKGRVYSAQNLMKLVTGGAGLNLGETPPVPIDLAVPFKHRTWSFIEAIKYNVIHTWVKHFDDGHYTLTASQGSLETGIKHFDFWGPGGGLLSEASPNKGGAETSSQFMTVSNPHQLLEDIQTQITHKGGYQAGQTTYENMRGSLTNLVRMINPKFSEDSVDNALSMMDCAPGDLLYLRDDGSGNLILSNTCAQDTGIPPEANLTNSTGPNQLVDFRTQPGQFFQTIGTLVDTAKNGSATAKTADAGLEKQPWINHVGNIQYEQGSILYKSSGYNNLLGQLDLYSRPAADVNVYFSHPN